MGNYPHRGYDYSRPGVAMITLKAHEALRLCNITATNFLPTTFCRIIQRELPEIHARFSQVKIGRYQVMPDHVHFLMHVVRPLSPNDHMLAVVEGFRDACFAEVRRQGLVASGVEAFFVGPSNHTLIFDAEHLQREVAYISANVLRYRQRKAHPELFACARRLKNERLKGENLWRFGNGYLLDKPRRVAVQVSRSISEQEMAALEEAAMFEIARGAVFVSPFISPGEKRIKDLAIANGCSIIHLVDREMSPRYKPVGEDVDLCCQGRLLDISDYSDAPGADPWRISRDKCLRLNRICAIIAEDRLLKPSSRLPFHPHFSPPVSLPCAKSHSKSAGLS